MFVPECSSDVGADYEPSDYKEKIFEDDKNLKHSRSTSLLEKEEALRRILEIKIKRYPLRQYINLGEGFDIHLRPNYYESEQEEGEVNVRNRRRRKSTPINGEDEAENEKESNLKKRRRCEGLADCLRKNFKDKNSNLQSNELNTENKCEYEQDSVYLTSTLTYTSKKQVIKLYQTEHLNAESPQKSNKNEFNHGVENYSLFKEGPSGINTQKEMGILYTTCQKKKVDTISKSDGKNDFFSQLGLKCQQISKIKNRDTQNAEDYTGKSESFSEHQPYNKQDLENKLKGLQQSKYKDKPAQYCYIHKKTVDCVSVKGELGKLKSTKGQRVTCTLDNNKVKTEKLREKIQALKEERRTLYKIKLALKSVICSEETCIKFCKPIGNTFKRKRNRSNLEQLSHTLQNDSVIDSTVEIGTVCTSKEGNEYLKPSNNEKTTDDVTLANDKISPENMFLDESEEDQDLRDLIAALTDSIDTDLACQDVKTGDKGIDNNSQPKPYTGDARLDMTGMEHYKKRLIHQHEKPSELSSPCTTTEEEDDSLESPLSPASSVQSRESGQQDKRREEVVQKVARKRAVCRSQFRHQSMELFKLGSSIPTSLCKTKEPYNICTEKNLQMCYQNGGSKKGDKNSPKGSLTESIIHTIEGKRKEVPLWRSVSLNNEISERQNVFSNSNPGSGRHILPAIVPELPERRKSRIKSLPENSSKSVGDNNEIEKNKSSNESLYEFVENGETYKTRPGEANSKKSTSTVKSGEETQENSQFSMENVREMSNTPARRQSIASSQSDVADCTPMNLSLKNRGTATNQPTWTELFNVHNAKRGELNNNQHLAHAIPKQPSNVPKRPLYQLEEDQNYTRTVMGENPGDKDGNCFFVTAIPSNALDPQKQSNVIVINFPHIQQQMSRMEKPNVTLPNPLEAQQAHLEMLDSAIMSLINIVKSSVESVFNILSLPVLNRLYIDLNRYLLLSTVSVKMKACIEEALNALISYLLVNLFRSPMNLKTRDFVHKLLQLDLRPHMDFLINSLDVIQQKMKYDYFMEHLLKVLSRNPQEDFAMPLPRRPFGDFPNIRPPRQYFANQNQPTEFRDYPLNRLWMENQAYQRGNAVMPNADFPGNIPQNQHQRRNRRHHQESDKHLLANMRVPENFNDPNLAVMRPDLYLADNRCIPPNISQTHSETLVMNTPQQPRAKGRPKNPSKITKIPNKLPENSLDLSIIPQPIQQRAPPEDSPNFEHRGRGVNIPNGNVSVAGRTIRRNSDVTTRDLMEENLRMKNRPQIIENRRLSEGALGPITENGTNAFSVNLQFRAEPRAIQKNSNGENNPKTFFKDNLIYPRITMPNDVDNMEISREQRPKHFTANVEVPIGGNAVISANDAPAGAKSAQDFTNNNPGAIVKQYVVSDVEQFLQTNIIVNQHQAAGTVHSTRSDVAVGPKAEKPAENGEKSQTSTYRNHTSNPQLASRSIDSETTAKESHNKQEESLYVKRQEAAKASVNSKDISKVIASTVIIKDKSMEISKGVRSASHVTNPMDFDDVVLERVRPTGGSKHGISYSSGGDKGAKRRMDDGNSAERLHLVSDVSIEKVTDEFETPPKLIKLSNLKRKNMQDERQRRKIIKRWPALDQTNSDDVVIIEDKETHTRQERLDYNQNNVTETDKPSEKSVNPITDITVQVKPSTNQVVTSKAHMEMANKNNVPIPSQQSHVKSGLPVIEDISSDEEVLEPFRHYSTYENKVPGDPRKILQTTEVSHCTLIDGNVKAIQNANRHLFEKPPVYTRPVMPRKARNLPTAENPVTRQEPLANIVKFKEDSDSLTCSLKVKNSELNYPSTMDVRRFSPGSAYQVASGSVSPGHFSPNFKSPSKPMTSPVVPGSPVAQMSSLIPRPPVVQTPRTVPGSPAVPKPSAAAQMSPVVARSPVLNEADINWRHWFSEEQRKGVFNFERSQSMESSTLSGRQSAEAPSSVGSDYCSKLSPEEPLCEIKFDSKLYRIKKSLFNKIPKGKLCYIRASNTFVRYFDDNQMELFISNLNLGEGSTVATDLLKQIRSRTEGPSDVERSTGQYEGSGKGEVITLSKDVVFSTEDFLSDPELYVEEVEKVQRYVPKDFYGFYKFVTGYQIVNHHPPISFQTFLTMHNTNGIKGLFKNYINTLAEGRNIL